MPRTWTMLMTRLLFGAAWQLGLNYGRILPADAEGRVTAIVLATSLDAFNSAMRSESAKANPAGACSPTNGDGGRANAEHDREITE